MTMTNKDQKFAIMSEAAKQLSTMIQARLSSRVDMLTTLSGSPLDNVPDSVKESREKEAACIRAVIQEQKDIISIINMLFPST